jgi:hypothetical protein
MRSLGNKIDTFFSSTQNIQLDPRYSFVNLKFIQKTASMRLRFNQPCVTLPDFSPRGDGVIRREAGFPDIPPGSSAAERRPHKPEAAGSNPALGKNLSP